MLGSIEQVRRTSPERRPTSTTAHAGGPVALAAVCVVALGLIGLLVATQATQGLDVAVRDTLRPGDEWSTAQVRVDILVEGLKPLHVGVLLVVFGLAVALARRSWRPAVYVAAVVVATAVSTLAVKFALGRTDPHHEMTALGGSFPSGHTASVVVGLGLVFLVLRSSARWWDWFAVAVLGAAMAFALVVQAAHWFTDVVGGAILGVAILSLASASTLREPPPQGR
jgi:membrane-associated phospholipid phosphatase